MKNMSFKFYDELIELFEKHFDNIIDELDSLDRIEALEGKNQFLQRVRNIVKQISN